MILNRMAAVAAVVVAVVASAAVPEVPVAVQAVPEAGHAAVLPVAAVVVPRRVLSDVAVVPAVGRSRSVHVGKSSRIKMHP